jgi:dinuclear metal center YbgI/SA1388 family protein
MQIGEIIRLIEVWAPPSLQEPYDNSGLLTGSAEWDCSGIMVALDSTEEVISNAKQKGCNLVIAHHPIIFSGLKKITGKNYVEKAIIAAIKQDVAIYSVHTNLDNVLHGVNKSIAQKLGMVNNSVLLPKTSQLKKLYTFVPTNHAEAVRSAIFNAGGGKIGNYSECSFNSGGTGTFKAEPGANPYVGKTGERHEENELKIEVIFPAWLEAQLIKAMKEAHPYEEVAYDIVPLSNENQLVGSGLVGQLPHPLTEHEFLDLLKSTFHLKLVRHTAFLQKPVQKIALCGGAGSFLTAAAIASGADAFVTADLKYHDFFDADGKLLLADIGHWESEQFTIDLLIDFLTQKIPTFAVLKTDVQTNPVFYYVLR